MPELPDLLYIREYFSKEVCGRTIVGAAVKQPVVLRVAVESDFADGVHGAAIIRCDINGPFIQLFLSNDRELILNLMLAGKLQHQGIGEKPEGYLCMSLNLDDGSNLNLCDEKKMAKAYLIAKGEHRHVPRFSVQGVALLSPEFTPELFASLAKKHSRKQVRVLLNDHTIISSIGNAYADEILFDAGIHPKTFVAKLNEEEIIRLYRSILSVMQWGIEAVRTAGQPIHVKVRGHMKVRNRKGEPCPRCGNTIRREGVRGYDVFFCPGCQTPTRTSFIDWSTKP